MTSAQPASTAPIVYERTFTLRADPARVFECLTSARHLRTWFAEEVEVGDSAGGPYRFWGKHTPWVPRATDATQRLTRLSPDEAVEFEWRWCDVPTTVAIHLAPSAKGTSARIRHVAAGKMLEFDCDDALMGDFWTLSMGNLREYLAHGRAALLPDYRWDGPGDVELSIEVNGPASEVWKALTDPKRMDEWISSHAEAEIRPGGRYAFGWKDPASGCPLGPQKILEVEPGKRLVHDWMHSKEAGGKTIWEVADLGGGTSRVTVRQVTCETPTLRTAYANGWAKFLLAIKMLIEGDPAPK